MVFPVLAWPDAGRAASVGDNEEGERMEVADMIQPSRWGDDAGLIRRLLQLLHIVQSSNYRPSHHILLHPVTVSAAGFKGMPGMFSSP